jgi:hypothetical protein
MTLTVIGLIDRIPKTITKYSISILFEFQKNQYVD